MFQHPGCDLKVTILQYLVSIQIKTTTATKGNPYPGIRLVPGLGCRLTWASKLGGPLGEKGHLARAKAREGVAPDRITEVLVMKSERPEGFHEATKALTLAVAGLTFMLISDLVWLILY